MLNCRHAKKALTQTKPVLYEQLPALLLMHGRMLAALLAALADARQQLQGGAGGDPGSSSSESRPQASPSLLRRLLLSVLVALQALLAGAYEVRSRCVCMSVSGWGVFGFGC